MSKREEIVNKVIINSKSCEYINAVWELGALAFDRVDEFSDIDLVFDVEDNHFDQAFEVVEKSLEEIAPIEYKLGSPNGIARGAYQNVYKLEGLSEFLVVEICFIPASIENKAMEKEIHGNITIHFDKKGVCNQHIDIKAFANRMERRFNQLKDISNIYQFLVKKEIKRNNPTEAYFYYFSVALNNFIELVRMRYNPFHYSFRHRYVYYELPIEIAKEIEEYTFVRDLNDLEEKHNRILIRFKEEIDFLNGINFEEHLNKHR